MVESKNGFVRLDLAISRKMHLANIANGVYPLLDDTFPNLRIKGEDVPNFSDLKKILEGVGKLYNWHLRDEYNEKQSIREISKKLNHPISRRFSFWAGDTEVGGAIIANIEPNVGRIFEKAHVDEESKRLDIDASMADKTVEIYKIGLFPKYTNRGWGRHFLPQVLTELFNHESQPEVVYLNTRSTNHSGVISFYTGLNMNVIHARSYPNDLISQEEYDKKNGNLPRRRNADKAEQAAPAPAAA